MNHVFISYARVDGQEVAEKLYRDLRGYFEVWLDIQSIPVGADWDLEIDKALENAKAVLVVLTPGSVVSLQVKSEWNYAINSYVPIFPILVKDCEVPRVLSVFNFFDLREQYTSGIEKLRQVLDGIDAAHLEHLKDSLDAIKLAQQLSENPGRFAAKINMIEAKIRDWSMRHQAHEYPAGTTDTLSQLDMQPAGSGGDLESQRLERHRVVGTKIYDVTDYFSDRNEQRKVISDLLVDDQIKLICVIGRGGIGKTALASSILANIEKHQWPYVENEEYVHGIIYLSTRTTGINLEQLLLSYEQLLDPERAEQIEQIRRNPAWDIDRKIDLLIEIIGQRFIVTLLDNFEDLLDESGNIINENVKKFIEKCLASNSKINFLVTTRAAVALSKQFLIYSKNVPLVDGLPETEAIELLRHLDPNGMYGLRDASREELAHVAAIVHGVPRALELVGAILANDPFIQLEDLVDKFYQHPEVGSELVEENYRRLNRDSRFILEALSVYKRPVSVAAVEFLLAPFVTLPEIPRIVKVLIDSYTLYIDRASKTISIHPIEQEYSYSRIPEEDSRGYTRRELERRAAEFYRHQLLPEDAWRDIDDLTPALNEFTHLVSAQDYSDAALLLDRIDLAYLLPWGYGYRVLEMREQLEDKLVDESALQRHYFSIGKVLVGTGEYKSAHSYAMTAYDLSLQLDQPGNVAESKVLLAEVLWGLGKFEEAEDLANQALEMALQLDDVRGQAQAYSVLSTCYRPLGQIQRAIDCGYKTLELCQLIGDDGGQITALARISSAYRDIGDYSQAIKLREQMLGLARDSDNLQGQMLALNMLGLIYVLINQPYRAVEYCSEGLTLSLKIVDRDGESFALSNLGAAQLMIGNYEAAVDYLSRSLVLQRAIDYKHGEAYTLNSIGVAFMAMKNLETALGYFEESLQIAHQINTPRLIGYCCLNLSLCHDKLGDIDRSLEFARMSADSFGAAGFPHAAPANALLKALQARLSDDLAGELESLVECAELLSSVGDFYCQTIDILDGVRALAHAHRFDLIASRADSLLNDLRLDETNQ